MSERRHPQPWTLCETPAGDLIVDAANFSVPEREILAALERVRAERDALKSELADVRELLNLNAQVTGKSVAHSGVVQLENDALRARVQEQQARIEELEDVCGSWTYAESNARIRALERMLGYTRIPLEAALRAAGRASAVAGPDGQTVLLPPNITVTWVTGSDTAREILSALAGAGGEGEA